MKNILIPTDFSDCANAASQFGIQFAKMSGAKIDFIHLMSTPVDWVKLSIEKESNYPETGAKIGHAKNELNQWIKNADNEDIEASQSLIFNKSIDEVFSLVENRQIDLIMMGSHGSQGFKEFIIGSNAQQILRNSKVPVLIIKDKIEKPIRSIIFVSDFKDVSQTAFSQITHFADILDAHIELLFVNTPNGFSQSTETDLNMNRVLEHCKREDTCTKNSINASSVEKGVQDFVKEKTVDLIAICTHDRSGLVQLFSPSIAESLANHISLPLLSIKL